MAGNRSNRQSTIARHPSALFLLLGILCFASECKAQEAAGQAAGQAEVAIQGYYLSGSGQPLIQTSGMSNKVTEFLPGVGLLTANVEGYGGDGFRTGNIFVGLEGTPLMGWHWDFVGGDYHFASELVKDPFANVYTPEIAGRGGEVAMRRTNRTYRFFVGDDTILAGPRIPFRQIMPQRIIGATMQQTVSEWMTFGVRYMNLETSPNAPAEYPTYFLPGRTYQGSNSIDFQSLLHFGEHLKVYGEAGYGTVSNFTPTTVAQKPLSFLVGPSWVEGKFSILGNYVHQSTSYMPLLGYFTGDRKGPYIEGHYRPFNSVEVYGSASEFANNLENNPNVDSFKSSGFTSGASFILPWKFNAGLSVTSLKLNEQDPTAPAPVLSNNSQINFTTSRPIGRHSLRFSLIDMKLQVAGQPQAQRFEEAEDTFAWKHFVLGGSMRFQNTLSSSQDLNTIFYRGSLQANIKRITAYAYLEKGNDLVNKSVFSTNSISSDVIGLSTPLFKAWTLQVEAFQNRLLTQLNPENIFLFGNGDQGLNTQLSNMNQRSIYIKIGKHYSWGKPLGQSNTMEEYAAVHAPLVGSIEGFVTEALLSGSQPAPSVTVILDHDRTVLSDEKGHYAFVNVPEGVHEIDLNMEELPADYAPGPISTAAANVAPRGVIRTDLNVVRLASLAGKITAPSDLQFDDVIIRLVGTKLYTTPYSDGTFAFYNLREGQYEVEIEATSLPDGYIVSSPERVSATAESGNQSLTVGFEVKVKPQVEKPVREMLKQEIHVNAPRASSQK